MGPLKTKKSKSDHETNGELNVVEFDAKRMQRCDKTTRYRTGTDQFAEAFHFSTDFSPASPEKNQ